MLLFTDKKSRIDREKDISLYQLGTSSLRRKPLTLSLSNLSFASSGRFLYYVAVSSPLRSTLTHSFLYRFCVNKTITYIFPKSTFDDYPYPSFTGIVADCIAIHTHCIYCKRPNTQLKDIMKCKNK